MPRYLLLTLIALLALNVPAHEQAVVQPPPAFKALYEVKKGPLKLGDAMRELAYGPDGELVFRTGSDTTGLAELLYSDHIRETTRLRLDGTRLRPLEYRYQRSGKRNRTRSQQFDWVQGKLTSRVDDALYEYPLPDDAIDPSAYQLKLMIDLARGEREFSYAVTGKREMRTYDIRHTGDERLQTVYGELETVVIQRKTPKRTTTMWCAPALNFLPVRIRHQEKDGTFTAYLTSVGGLKTP